ncbi:MAG: hypothetical protein QGH14_06570, partial [Candidatus Bathyarchaeota archaeon]|nr:hypothetical protein [Candidatus Bathyarchaeota archaeon]
LAEASQLTQSATALNKNEAEARQGVLQHRRDILRLLASKVTLGRVVVSLGDLEKFAGSQDDIIMEDGDSLVIPPTPSTVVVMGSVRNPTAVRYIEDQDVLYYVNRAGGMNMDASEKDSYLLKADGSAISGFLKLRDIDPGDIVVVPPSTEAKLAWLALLKDLSGMVGQVGSVALGVAGLA